MRLKLGFEIIFLIIIFLEGCRKKYPENSILFAPPEKVLAKLSGAKIVYCKIDGVDSTELMKQYDPNYTSKKFYYYPNGNGHSSESSYYCNAEFTTNKGSDLLSSGLILEWTLSRTKFSVKNFNINIPLVLIPTLSPDSLKYPPYIRYIEFEIIKLTPKELKVKGYSYSKNKTYELYFAK